jgi:hypothetical protein
MGLCDLNARLRADVTRSKCQAFFESARGREPTLANHDSIRSILREIECTHPATYESREELFRAVLREHQLGITSLWGALLLIAFSPMLCHLRYRARSTVIDVYDVEQFIVEGFLVAIATQRTEPCNRSIAASLRVRTYEFVFSRLDAERRFLRRRARLAQIINPDDAFELWLRPIGNILSDDEVDELAGLLFTAVGSFLPKHKLDVVIATRLRGISIREYIEECRASVADASDITTQELNRIAREQTRTLERLRMILRRPTPATADQVLGKSRLKYTD